MTQQAKTTEQLHREWLEHPHFKYRGCAPDADDPLRMAGDPSLPVGAHHGPDAFAPEGQKERRAREAAAVEVCVQCPVMVACDRYASSVRSDGRLAEPDGVWGGRRARERKDAFKATRHEVVVAAPARLVRTPQKLSVLRALALCWDPFEVAAASGLDVRTANWQRSRIATDLGLPKTVSRGRMLSVAVSCGLVDASLVVADDGSVPAVPPPTRVTAAVEPTQLSLWEAALAEKHNAPPRPARRVRRARSGRVVSMPTLDDAFELAPVIPLFPSRRLEAAV